MPNLEKLDGPRSACRCVILLRLLGSRFSAEACDVKTFIFGLLLAISGCAVDRGTRDVGGGAESETSLRGLLPENAVLVGVTLTPNGKRYVLDQQSGLYELGDSSATRVWDTTGFSGIELTDVVAIDNDRFAVTAENDGFLLNVRDHSFSSYFCYLPRTPVAPAKPISVGQTLALEGIPSMQRTESVAFNPDSLQLFAQPQTVRLDTSTVAGSELFVFDPSGGQPIQVFPLNPSFVAGGMVAASGGRLIVGAGNAIYELSLSGGLTLLREIDASITITGMASSPDGELWVLDGAGQRLVAVPGILQQAAP
jgi:hypothetical protein